VFRQLRILFLLLILLLVSVSIWMQRVETTDWDAPLLVALYPINADGSERTEAYLDKLQGAQFESIEHFFDDERREYGVALERPVRFALAPILNDHPPKLGRNPHVLQIMGWSLRLRWWANFDVPDAPGPTPTIRLFLMYYAADKDTVLPHSTALQNGLIGVVNVFADKSMNGSNDVVIAHELLHTLGATDKYDLATTLPSYPLGFAEPDQKPLYPQSFAELMGGRVPLTQTTAAIPDSLDFVLVGPATAIEIGWKK
jgi:hypothetical protein